MRRVIAAPIAILAFLLTCVTATASGPTRDPAPLEPILYSCGDFDVLVTLPTNTEYILGFESSQIVTGALKATFTNLSNGKSLTANVSGPGFGTFSGPLLTITSTGLFSDGFFVFAGRSVFTINFDTGETSFSLVGHTLTDICAAIA